MMNVAFFVAILALLDVARARRFGRLPPFTAG
jgi:hypothetical protein